MRRSNPGRYILLPKKVVPGKAYASVHTLNDLAPALRGRVRLVRALNRRGARLIEADAATVEALRAQHPELVVAPVRTYRPAWVDRTPRPQAVAAQSVTAAVTVVSQQDGKPVAGASVDAIADMSTGAGVAGTTDANGVAKLALAGPSQQFAAFYVVPRSGYWGFLAESFVVTAGTRVEVAPIDLSYTDALRYFYGSPDGAGAGVRVGVIDSGAGPHPDLVLAGGKNVVEGESPADYGDNGIGHGTHVAGILGARGTPPSGMCGAAPGVAMYAYRVYPQSQGTCTTDAIVAAIDQALVDGCDLLNISIGLDDGDGDEAVHAAIEDARAQGSVVVAASGNTMFGARGAVLYPASDPLALAVSAMGRIGLYPNDALETGEQAAPYGTDPQNYVASFSNVGPQIALTGPGVGIISTFPGPAYAVMDGTSMASPAACARLAVLLAARPDILGMPRDASRAAAIAGLAANAAPLGFGATYEGHGMLS